MALKVTGIFEDDTKAEDAQLYLLGNGFSDGTADEELINTAVRTGNSLILHLETHIEAQEGVDVLNNYGAIEVEYIKLER